MATAHSSRGGGALDRARHDLDLFVRQHRLDGELAKLGFDALAERG